MLRFTLSRRVSWLALALPLALAAPACSDAGATDGAGGDAGGAGGAGGADNNAWWSVDAATGATIGRGDGGEGQSAMEYLQITKKNVENLKCMVGFSNQIIKGDAKKDTAQQWFMCMTASDNPGSGHGIPGAVESVYEADMGIGMICDVLGGAKDLYDIANPD